MLTTRALTIGGQLWRVGRERPAFVLLSAIALAFTLRAAIFAYLHFSSPAWFDFWLWVQDYQRWVEGHFTFHDLIKPHYDDAHRIATTRVLLLLDSIFFDMNGRLAVIASFLLLLGVGWMVSRLARRDGLTPLLPPLVWIALACSVCQVDNLIYPFQVQFPITCALGCGCAWLLTASARAARPAAIGGAAAAGLLSILAAFSMGSGVLMVPSLLLLLALRRARWEAWAVFTPLGALGVALYEHHRRATAHLPLLGWGLTWSRFRYVGNFLASEFNQFVTAPVWLAGIALLAGFAVIAAAIARRYVLRGRAVPSGDAALLALGIWVASCGPAGSFTLRIVYGPGAALVGRYATMSLLFTGVLLALVARAAARAGNPIAARVLLPVGAVMLLGVCSLPAYDERARSLQRVIAADAELFVNNIALQGPAPLIFNGTIENVRAAAMFLHARHLNMFAPENGPPASLRDAVLQAAPASLPACRGWLDYAYALDASGFLAHGWATDPSGKHNASWIAARDEAGGLVGMARPLGFVPGLWTMPGATAQALAFESGFRFATPPADPDQARRIQIIGVFPGRHVAMCRLPQTGLIGPAWIAPAKALEGAVPLAEGSIPAAQGFAPLQGGGPDHVAAWRFAGGKNGTLSWSFPAGTGVGHDVAVPFATVAEGPGRRIILHLNDGTQIAMDLPSLWRRPDWRAVVLPSSVVARHGGLVRVDIQAQGETLDVGAPVAAFVNRQWARLF